MTEEKVNSVEAELKAKHEAIKEKYGPVVLELVVDDNGVERRAYVQKPNRYQLSPVLAVYDRDPVHAYELMYNTCVISELSDPKIIADDDLFISVMKDLDKLIFFKKKKSTFL